MAKPVLAWWRGLPVVVGRAEPTDLCYHCGHARDRHWGKLRPACEANKECSCPGEMAFVVARLPADMQL